MLNSLSARYQGVNPLAAAFASADYSSCAARTDSTCTMTATAHCIASTNELLQRELGAPRNAELVVRSSFVVAALPAPDVETLIRSSLP
jgi:hypothetical protein